MSEQSENKGKLNCHICPFLDCYENGTCYNCNCYIEESLKDIEIHCDDKTLHPDCPLMKGLKVKVYTSEDGDLIIKSNYE